MPDNTREMAPSKASPAPGAGPSGDAAQTKDAKASLRGRPFAEQEAALTPQPASPGGPDDPYKEAARVSHDMKGGKGLSGKEQTIDTGLLRSKEGSQGSVVESEAKTMPKPTDKLPFDDKGGWDVTKLLSNLSQYDLIEETDSDNDRCVQTAAMAIQVARGPDAVVQWLAATSVQGLLEERPTDKHADADKEAAESQLPKGSIDRKLACAKIISVVQARIKGRSATYGDLSWALEAAHDMTYKEGKGTDGKKVMEAMSPLGVEGMESYQKGSSLGKEVKGMASLEPHLKDLKPGEQLILFSRRMLVGASDAFGHQFLVFNQGGALYAYNPAGSVRLEAIPDPKAYFGAMFTPKKGVESTRYIVVAGKASTPPESPFTKELREGQAKAAERPSAK